MPLQFIQSTSTFMCQMLETKRVLPISSAISWFCSLFSTSFYHPTPTRSYCTLVTSASSHLILTQLLIYYAYHHFRASLQKWSLVKPFL